MGINTCKEGEEGRSGQRAKLNCNAGPMTASDRPIENLDAKRALHICPPLGLDEKQRHYFANKGPSSQGNGFSSGHVWM